jgi:hypothetical protein
MTIMAGHTSSVPPAPRRGPGDERVVARVWRALAALGVLVSGIVHAELWVQGYADIDVVGPLFLLNAISAATLTLLLVVWHHWLPLVGGIAFGGATLLAFVLSTTVGFYGVSETFAGTEELAAAGAELVAVVASTLALVREHGR